MEKKIVSAAVTTKVDAVDITKGRTVVVIITKKVTTATTTKVVAADITTNSSEHIWNFISFNVVR